MKIYLAGKVPKGDGETKTFQNWRDKYEKILHKLFPDADFIEPYHRDLDESDFLLVVGSHCGKRRRKVRCWNGDRIGNRKTLPKTGNYSPPKK